jgi:hypothetical protein
MNTSTTKILIFTILGGIGAFIGSLLGYLIAKNPSGGIDLLFKTGCWDAVIGIGIGAAFVLAQSWYLKQIQTGLRGNFKIIGMSAIAGFSGGICLILLRYLLKGLPEGISLICAWTLEGTIIGFLIAPVIPNLPRKSALVAGSAAGLLGAITMIRVSGIGMTEWISVAIGDSFKGVFLGLMFTLTEKIVREAWLEIQYNSKEIRTVSLGATPISIGSDTNLATVYVKNIAPLAMRYQLQQGKVWCEDISTGTKRSLSPGNQQMVGNLTVIIRAASSNSQLTPLPASISSDKPFSLHLIRKIIPLNEGTQLRSDDLPGLEPQGADLVVASVSQNPKNPDVLGLKNTSFQIWNVNLVSGDSKQIEPGRTVKLLAGTYINFGSVGGEIKQ